MVAWATAVSLAGWGVLLAVRPEIAQPPHYALFFAATLVIVGCLVGYQAWRTRVLREYYGGRRSEE
jgi:hypothetical protein